MKEDLIYSSLWIKLTEYALLIMTFHKQVVQIQSTILRLWLSTSGP